MDNDDDDDDDDEFAGFEDIKEFSNCHPGIVHPDLVVDDVDVSFYFARKLVAHVVIEHTN